MIYRHIPTGNLYEKLYDSQLVDEKISVVVYRSLKDNRVWVRTSDRFNERFERVQPTGDSK